MCKTFTMESIKLRDAIARMRQLTKANVPFSFSFISYSESLQKSDGYKVVENAILRTGYRSDQSDYSSILVAYTSFTKDGADRHDEADRHFYLPLLMTFNNIIVVP